MMAKSVSITLGYVFSFTLFSFMCMCFHYSGVMVDWCCQTFSRNGVQKNSMEAACIHCFYLKHLSIFSAHSSRFVTMEHTSTSTLIVATQTFLETNAKVGHCKTKVLNKNSFQLLFTELNLFISLSYLKTTELKQINLQIQRHKRVRKCYVTR